MRTRGGHDAGSVRGMTADGMVPGGRVQFLGIRFDRMTMPAALDWLRARSADTALAYVVTPNVDHMVRLEAAPPALRAAYEKADLCLCDSRVLARLARLCGIDLPVVPGSDLVGALFARGLEVGDRVCLIGGSDEIAARIGARFPDVTIVHHAPPMGLLHDAAARGRAIEAAAAARARAVLLAVGSPQQELLAWEMRAAGSVRGTALCIGAGVDFLAGAQARAPRIVQRAGFEWAWRLATSPRRLARRYLVDGPAIFPLVWRWRRAQRR